MKKPKQGIYDGYSRKIIGVVRIDDGFQVEVNGEIIDLAENLSEYKDCDIVITVSDNSSSYTDE